MQKALIGLAITVSLMGASPVFAADTLLTVSGTSGGSGWPGFGQATSGQGSAMQFSYIPSASHNVCSVSFDITKNVSPTDQVTVAIYQGPIATASTTSLGSATLMQVADNADTISSFSYVTHTYTFTPCVIVAGGWQYWIKVYRTGAASDPNYYTLAGSVGAGASASSHTTVNQPTYEQIGGGIIQVGGATTFYQMKDSVMWSPIVISGSQNYGTIGPTSTPTFGSSVVNYLAGVTESNASSTLSTGNAGFNAFTSITGFFQDRVPFGYIWDIRDLFVAAATTTSDFGTVRFDFTNTNISTTTRSWLPGNLAVFSTSTVTSLISSGNLAAINSVVSASILVGWLIYAFYRIKNVVPTV